MTKLSEIFGLRAGEPTEPAPTASEAENPEPPQEAAPPYPSSYAKQQMCAQIEALAQRGAPAELASIAFD